MYGPLVWSMARRRFGRAADAEDAVQEVFVAIWRAAQRFDPARGSEAAFVATVAKRRLVDHRRRVASRRADRAHEALGACGVAEPPVPWDGCERVTRFVDALPDDERCAVRLWAWAGLSHAQVAAATGAPLGTVKTRLRRAMLRLRSELIEERGLARSA